VILRRVLVSVGYQ